MKEIILRILRQTSLTDNEKLKAIFESLQEDNKYGFNELVKLNDTEFKKLNDTYGTVAINQMVENLDSYIYKTGKKYKSHYLTIAKWLNKEGATKIKKTYVCSYGTAHYVGSDCDCGNF